MTASTTSVPAGAGRTGTARPEPAPKARLTQRELQWLHGAAAGRSNGQIATTLGISEDTAKSHGATTMRKLRVDDRTLAVVTAHRVGLIDLNGPVLGEPALVVLRAGDVMRLARALAGPSPVLTGHVDMAGQALLRLVTEPRHQPTHAQACEQDGAPPL